MPKKAPTDVLDETKKKVRALLLSVKNGLTLRDFISDFRDLIGQPFPFRDAGYPTAESCLMDMRDVVTVTYQRDGNVVLRGVADATTQHIAELVSKQKSKKGSRPRIISQKTRQATVWRARQDRQQHREAVMRPLVPPFIRTQIAQLLRNTPDGVLGSSFNALFSRTYGIQIDYNRLRFNNIKELLLSLGDIVEIEELRTGGYRVNSAERSGQGRFVQPSTEKYVPPHLRSQMHHENKPSIPLNQPPAQLTQTRTPPRFERVPPSQPPVQELPTSQTESSRASPTEKKSPHHHRKSRRSPTPVFEDGIPNDVKKKLLQILQRRTAGMFSRRLQREYKEFHNEDLPFQKFGFSSIIEFVSALPDIVAIERPNLKGDWILYDAETHQPREPTPPRPKEVEKPPKPHVDLEGRLAKLVKSNPNGLRLVMLPDVYKQTFAEDLIPREFGFQSMDALVRSFADHLLVLLYRGNGEVYVYPVKENSRQKSKPPSPQKGPAALEESAPFIRRIPPDAVLSGNTYKKQYFPHNVEYMEVFVSNVNHPGKIWVQLKGRNTTEALEEVMDKLEEIYCGNQLDLYEMPKQYLEVGMPCVTVFPEDQNWHRCTVASLPNQETVEVFFVDYGNRCNVARSSVYFLKGCFLKLPAQAIQARLSNITMVNEKYWTEASKVFLLKLVANKPLVSYVTETKNDILSICLCDTSGKEDIHINDLLVEECHAKFLPDNISPEDIANYEQEIQFEPCADFPPLGATAEQYNIEENMENLEIEYSGRRYLKFVRLGVMYDVHLINYQGKAYLPSTEISAFFWDTNKLRSMLRNKKVNPANIVVCQDDDPELFEEFRQYKVKGLVEEENEEQVKPYTTIYELAVVPEILEVFKHPVQELKTTIADLIQKFDPEDPYWKGEDTEESTEESEAEALLDYEIGLDDLNLMLKAMQFRRHRLLQDMSSSAFSETTVDEVNEVEIQINAIQEKIKSVSGNKQTKKQKPRTETAHIVRASSDEYIQNCLDNFQEEKPQPTKDIQGAESKTTNVNRVAPFMDSSAATQSEPTISSAQGLNAPTANAPSGLPGGDRGGGDFQMGAGNQGLPGNLGIPGLLPLQLNQALLTPEQQQQILTMASLIQAQGVTMAPGQNLGGMPNMGRGANQFMFQQPMMNLPGLGNMPNFGAMPPLGRGQQNTMPGPPGGFNLLNRPPPKH